MALMGGNFRKIELEYSKSLLHRIGQSNNQSIMLKDMFASMKSGKACDLQGLLEILNSNNDVDMQIKLFSILSASLMLNVSNIDLIITYNPLYDKICNILANCPPRKITVVLNFLSALLYVSQEKSPRNQNLVLYVKNMLRSSGCLATMCELFTTSMMHQDAWRALCRCLAESCRGVEDNQSYCTHLVPMCIQRCSPRNIEVLLVLQSLLQSHAHNINLFIESNGMTLFQREFLQHDMCLQLLATIAQSSSDARTVIVKTQICQILRDFLQFYGPESQLGQWATIILYYTSRVEATAYKVLRENDAKRVQEPTTTLLESINIDNHNRDLECSANTTKFFQNVMKEIAQCSGQKEFKTLQSRFPLGTMNRSQTTNYFTRLPFNISQRNKVWVSTQDINKPYSKTTSPNVEHVSVQFNETNELSFSFLRKHLHNTHVTPNYITNKRVPDSLNRTFRTNESYLKKSFVYDPLNNTKESRQITQHLNDFNPRFASTPKKGVNETCKDETLRTNSLTRRSIQRSTRNHQIKRRSGKRRVTKNFEQTKIYTEIKHRSIGGRFFDAINTSCTTLVNTVKNIFRPKSTLHETKEDSTHKMSKIESSSCSYSFTNYMRKRDAMMKKETISQSSQESLVDSSKGRSEDVSIEMTNSCKTCNDTVALKCKLTNDGHLKQTIRKLKLGINLYGCDFKKISQTMWPNETYMSPTVLYNLYRKLIIK